jgi:hypothetical protein
MSFTKALGVIPSRNGSIWFTTFSNHLHPRCTQYDSIDMFVMGDIHWKYFSELVGTGVKTSVHHVYRVRKFGSRCFLHSRDGLPALQLRNGTKKWYQMGSLHGTPAVTRADGRVEYWRDHQRVWRNTQTKEDPYIRFPCMIDPKALVA